jgi:hypothetical protein
MLGWIPSLAVLGIGCALLGNAFAQQAPQEQRATKSEKLSFWMDVKLQESQSVLASLAAGDFNKIGASAEKLTSLDAIEGFIRRSTPGYQTQLKAFELAVGELRRQAKRENIEGVTLAFHQLTTSCVNCHMQLRDASVIQDPAP